MQNQSEQQISNLKTQTEQQIYSRIIDAKESHPDKKFRDFIDSLFIQK